MQAAPFKACAVQSGRSTVSDSLRPDHLSSRSAPSPLVLRFELILRSLLPASWLTQQQSLEEKFPGRLACSGARLPLHGPSVSLSPGWGGLLDGGWSGRLEKCADSEMLFLTRLCGTVQSECVLEPSGEAPSKLLHLFQCCPGCSCLNLRLCR